MISRTITPKVGIKNEKGEITERICFPLREVSASEESEFWQAMAAISDKPEEEKTDLRFDLMVETIANWTAEMPFIRTQEKNKKGKLEDVDTPISGDGNLYRFSYVDPADAVREYFQDKTMQQERMVNSIITAYSNEVAPNIVF